MPDIMYEGIIETSTKFLAYLNNHPVSSLADKYDEKIFTDNNSLAPISAGRPLPIVVNDTVNIMPTKTKRSTFDFGFFKGNKINSGGQITYTEFLNNIGSKFELGLGMGITYVNINYIKNKSTKESGELVYSSFLIRGRYYFNENNKGAYLSGGCAVNIGNESYNDRKLFIIGPTIDASFGVQIGSAFSLQAGYFANVLFGSKILPNDHGLAVTLSVKTGFDQ